MDTKEKIKVMQAYAEGRPIQYRLNWETEWSTTSIPIWDWHNCQYRIKPVKQPLTPADFPPGSKPIQGITVAASRKYPLNTPIYIHIPGVVNNKRYLISDRLHPKYDNRIDIYFNNHKRAKQFGVKNCLASYRDWETDRKSTRLNSSHSAKSRMPSSA